MKKLSFWLIALVAIVIIEYVFLCDSFYAFLTIVIINIFIMIAGIILYRKAASHKRHDSALLLILIVLIIGCPIYKILYGYEGFNEPQTFSNLEKYGGVKVERLGHENVTYYGGDRTISRLYRVDGYEFTEACTSGRGIFGNINNNSAGCRLLSNYGTFSSIFDYIWTLNNEDVAEIISKYKGIIYDTERYSGRIVGFIKDIQDESELVAFFNEYLELPEVRKFYKTCYAGVEKDIYNAVSLAWCDINLRLPSQGIASLHINNSQSIFEWAYAKGIQP